MVNIKIFFFFFALMILVGVPTVCLHYNFLALLRKDHPMEWERLGKPTLFKNNSIKSCMGVFNFLRKKEYLKSNDQKLIKYGQYLSTLNCLYISILIINFVLFILFISK